VAVVAEYSQIDWIVVGRISINMVDHNMLSFMANAAGSHVGYEKRVCHSRWYRGARFMDVEYLLSMRRSLEVHTKKNAG
jgi:hypothetical protein